MGAQLRQPPHQRQKDYTTHLDYIEQNPVRAGLVVDPGMHEYSSANSNHQADPTPTYFN